VPEIDIPDTAFIRVPDELITKVILALDEHQHQHELRDRLQRLRLLAIRSCVVRGRNPRIHDAVRRAIAEELRS
jgi:hypothetical protein